MAVTKLRALLVPLVSAACLAAPAVVAPSSAAHRSVAPDPGVITHWNGIATRTIYTERMTPIPSSGLYLGFVSIAMYDAVVSIEGGYEPYGDVDRVRGAASPEAAAATAAHQVLSHYFPASQSALKADYDAYLATLSNRSGLARGIEAGRAAAVELIASRQGDGVGAAVTLNVTLAPGVWRPTPDAFAPMAVPWLGFVRPLALRSPTQVDVDGPDRLRSRAYARDVAEVRAFGAKDGSMRTAAQTETALFWNANAVLQYQVALREQVTRRGLGIVESARAFAMLGTATADSLIACWRGKSDHAYWRPITAIRTADTDGNPRTQPDPAWTPLIPNPPYPEYPSGHACVTGAMTGTLAHLFGTSSLGLSVSSSVTGTTRSYDSTAALDEETMNGRIWLGIHFRRAMADGNELGHDVADWVAGHHFEPDGDDDDDDDDGNDDD